MREDMGLRKKGVAGSGTAAMEGENPFGDTTQQIKDVERAYGGRAAYDRAKVAGKTRLTYGQWVQVRTPNFIRWFGDHVIASAVPQRQASNFDQAREQAKAFQGKPLTNPASGIVATVSRNNLDKMLSEKAVDKSAAPALHSVAVANLDGLFERAILGWSKPDAKGDPNIKAIHRFFTPLLVDGEARLVKMTVKETGIESDPNPLYTVEAVEFNEKSPAAQWVAASLAADGLELTSIRSAGDVQSLAQRVQDFNPDAVSKVVDTETGEPMVVYHGTKADVSAFDAGRAGEVTDSGGWGRGIYFAADPGYASVYAGRAEGSNVIPVYVALQNPLVVDARKRADAIRAMGMEVPKGDPTKDWSRRFAEAAQRSGHDGVLVTLDGEVAEIVAFRPEQVKSATGNIGTFDGSNGDIRLRQR